MTIRPLPLRPAASLLLAAVALTLGACASAPIPMQEMAVADAAVQRANGTRTAQLAPAELAVAVNKLTTARTALAAGNQDQARRLANEATLDAQVAELRADAVQAATAARESEDAARALREEINRKTPR